MLPVYKVALPKMGIYRTIPLQYRYAPKYLNGLGLPNIYTLQGIEKMKVVINHMNSGTKLGSLLMAQLEACNIEMGTNNHIMELTYSKWEILLTDCWFKHLWQFFSENSIKIRGPYARPSMNREHD